MPREESRAVTEGVSPGSVLLDMKIGASKKTKMIKGSMRSQKGE